MKSRNGGRQAARWVALLGALVTLAASATAQAGTPPLTFGIYAGGQVGIPGVGLSRGPADNPRQIQWALNYLQHGDRPFMVRVFSAFEDQPAGTVSDTLPSNAAQFAVNGRKLDLVLAYSSANTDLRPWVRWVKDMVHAYGPALGSVQITEEANYLLPPGENAAERVRQAVVSGTLAADEQLRADGRRHCVDIGMSAVAFGDPDAAFWSGIGAIATPAFHDALDYVSIDMYPDVFFPGDVSDELTYALNVVRNQSLPLAGIDPDVPIRVGENGWPTGFDPQFGTRTEAQQVAKLEEAVTTVSGLRRALNITHYEFWDLRDADSTQSSIWYQFGLLHSDYTPKPAFDKYRQLIRQYGSTWS